jgi:hypothetical protein
MGLGYTARMLKFTLSAHAETAIKERSIKHDVTAYFDRTMKGKL